jgi:hypothetical protein
VVSLFLVLLLLWFVLTVFLGAWTLLLQAYFYTEPVKGLAWRAPAAGSAVFLTVILWVCLDFSAPERYSTLWEFSAEDEIVYPTLIVPQRDGKEDAYTRVRADRGYVYKRLDRPIPTRPDKVIAVSSSHVRREFVPDRDDKGHFKETEGQGLLYRDQSGQVMVEGQLGSVRTFYPGRLFANLFLNFFHLVMWFVALWLLLRFQWSHAFGMALVLWGVMLLFVMPQVLKLAEDTALNRAPPTQTAPR